MPRNNYGFSKRQREIAKKKKKAEKQGRKDERKAEIIETNSQGPSNEVSSDGSSKDKENTTPSPPED
jgi:hypothetical protein